MNKHEQIKEHVSAMVKTIDGLHENNKETKEQLWKINKQIIDLYYKLFPEEWPMNGSFINTIIHEVDQGNVKFEGKKGKREINEKQNKE